MEYLVEKIISGGQTGAERAGLDVGLELGIPIGGHCPKGRRSSDGPIDEKYPLEEMASRAYPPRTERNVQNGDGTVILTLRGMGRGSALTKHLAEKHSKPLLCYELSKGKWPKEEFRQWLRDNDIKVLNVAGSAEETSQGIYAKVCRFLFDTLQGGGLDT